MRRRSTATWAAVVLVVALLVVAAGCGGKNGDSTAASSASAFAVGGVSADQVVKDSEARMAQVKSASFVMDAGLTVQGDTSQITDPMTKALLASGIAVHADGKSQTDPPAADMTISLGIAGQTLELGMMTQGTQSWVEYQGQWYAVDSKTGQSLDKQARIGASPTEQLKSLGLDPAAWGLTYTMVGGETLNGVKVYHVQGSADPQKLAESLLKAAEDPSLAKKLGGQAQLKQLGQALAQSKQQAQQLGKSLKEATVEYWIGVDDSLMYKTQIGATLDMSGQQGMSGVNGIGVKMTVSLSDFDQPVTVTPPANALPLKSLTQKMFGSLGSLGGLTF
jgi:hypothetical protein